MIAVKWTGRAVSSNRRHTISRTTGYIINTTEYKNFLKDLAWTIKSQTRGLGYEKIRVVIEVTVNNRYDHHNLHKPIMDAIQMSGLIENDKNIMYINWRPPIRHKQKELDEIFLFISEVRG